MWALFESSLGNGQVRHQCIKILSYGAECLSNLLKIMYLLTRKKVEGSLSKNLCTW